MILVAGGTGRLGSLVANRLVEDGHPVRALSRGLAPQPGILAPGVERVHGDVRDPASLREAMADVDAVVSCVQGFVGPGGVSPETVDKEGNQNLVDAAKKAGADVVMVSVAGASRDHPMELMRAKHAAEEYLRRSGLPWTIVRAEAYAETWAAIMAETSGSSGRPLVFGRADNPIAWVSVQDVATLVVRAVEDQHLRGRTLEICGPEPWTLMQLAQACMDRQGRSGHPRRVPRPVLHLMANTVGRLKPEVARQARAALAMDGVPLADDSATRDLLPELPGRPVSEVVAELPAWAA